MTGCCWSQVEKSCFAQSRDVSLTRPAADGRSPFRFRVVGWGQAEHVAGLGAPTGSEGVALEWPALGLHLARQGEGGAELLVVGDRCLIDAPQRVEGPVGQVHAVVADPQPSIRIVVDGEPLANQLAARLGRLQDEDHLVVEDRQRCASAVARSVGM